MHIYITTGQGQGQTEISAFDAALRDAGIANFNLIKLSSIIPPNSVVQTKKYCSSEQEFGNKLYAVKSEQRSQKQGQYIGASLGWYQFDDGRGLFVEHEATGETAEVVEDTLQTEIMQSLADLCCHRSYPFHKERCQMELCITRVAEQPAAVLVAAVYASEGWT